MSRQDDDRRTHRRRTVLAAAGGGLAVGLAGCLGDASGGNATKTSTPTATPELNAELAALREATKQYRDPKAALKAGFKIMGPYVPGMGWHFIKPKRVKAAAKNGFDRTKPQLLTYVKGENGLTLGAAEFAAPKKAVDGTPDLFSDGSTDATEKWHTHKAATHVFAVPDGTQTSPKKVSFEQWVTNDHWAEFRPPDEKLKPGDTATLNWGSLKAKQGDRTERVVDVASTHPTLTTLHVWVHAENPDGVFHATNSRFGGGDGHDH